MSRARNEFLAHGSSDESDNESEAGYDSEAAEVSKSGRSVEPTRGVKRRKLSHSSSEDEETDNEVQNRKQSKKNSQPTHDSASDQHEDEQLKSTRPKPKNDSRNSVQTTANLPQILNVPTQLQTPSTTKSKHKSKPSRPGVVYLSSLPPYLKPSALRNLLSQRGFEPITRLFLTPASKSKSKSKSSRQLYTEGWIEFSSHRMARRCAESLNAHSVGGKKGGFYHDDIWNMKYLSGMGWEELMAGVREERREQEGRRDEERRQIASETKMFVEGVEMGKRESGMRKKRQKKNGKEQEGDPGGEVKRTWRQFEVKGGSKVDRQKAGEKMSEDVRQVLGKIF